MQENERERERQRDRRQTYPRTSIANIEVIPPLLSRELGAGRVADPVAERARLPLELARLVARRHPVRDLPGGRSL